MNWYVDSRTNNFFIEEILNLQLIDAQIPSRSLKIIDGNFLMVEAAGSAYI